MSIRVNPDPSSELLAAINLSQQNIDTTLQEMSTGRSVNSLGDNPAAAASLVDNHTQTAQVDQFLQNISSVQGLLQVGDSTMSSAVNLMTQAISLGIEGATGTVSAENRQAIAEQMTGILQQMMGLANTTYQGNYVFAGTADQTQPFTSNSASPDGVDYNGNTGVNSVELASGESVAINVPGSQIFANPAGDVLGALNGMITALQSGTGLDAANAALDNAFNELNAQRVFYGNGLQQIETATSFLSQDKVELSQQENDLVGADMSQVVSDYSQAEVQQQAVLTAAGKIIGRPTLFDYLPNS
jgi:flagellar hook-associated protein 3 FlgL